MVLSETGVDEDSRAEEFLEISYSIVVLSDFIFFIVISLEKIFENLERNTRQSSRSEQEGVLLINPRRNGEDERVFVRSGKFRRH